MALLDIKKISSFDELLALEKEWNGVLLKSETNTIFLTHEWIMTWWKCFGHGKELLVLLVIDNSNIIGIAPLMITSSKHFGFQRKNIEFIGTPLLDYSDFIISEQKEDVIKAIYEFLFNNRELWDSIVLEEVPQNSSTLQLSEKILGGLTRNFDIFFTNECLALNFDGCADGIIQMLQKKRDIMRQIRAYGSDSSLIYHKVENPDEANDLLEIFFEQHIRLWEKRQIPSIFRNDIYKEFMTQLMNGLLPKNKLEFRILKFNQEIIATQIGFTHNNKYLRYLQSYDLRYSKNSPGAILHRCVIEEHYNNKFDEVDFSRGAESYKYRFSNKITNNYGISIDKNVITHYFAKKYHKIKEKIMKNKELHQFIQKYKNKILQKFITN